MTEAPPVAEVAAKLLQAYALYQWTDEVERNPHGACIGCGFCCDSGPCVVAMVLYPKLPHGLHRWVKGKRCPSLVWNGKRHLCGAYAWRLVGKRLGVIGMGNTCLFPTNPYRGKKLKDRRQA